MAISPWVEARRWIYGTLQPDGVLNPLLGSRYYESPAPVDAVDPFAAIWQYQSPRDLYTNGASRVWTDVYVRLAVAQRGTSVSHPFDLEAIDNRITLLLHGKSGSTATASVQSCVRVGPAVLPLDFDKRTGAFYYQIGSDWHLTIQ